MIFMQNSSRPMYLVCYLVRVPGRCSRTLGSNRGISGVDLVLCVVIFQVWVSGRASGHVVSNGHT